MSQSCGAILERLVESLTGSVPPEARAGIVEHLAVCAACREEAAALEATVGRLRAGGADAPPPGFWTDFSAGLEVRLAGARRPVGARLRRWLAAPRHAWAAAAAALAMVLAVGAAVRFTPTPAPPEAADGVPRHLVSEQMTRTAPSLAEMLQTWQGGLVPTAFPDGTGP